MLFHSHHRQRIQWLLAAVFTTVLLGCRGRAQREMYEAKMAHEIRVLEDQLYEADYHNRVLIDKLEQLRLKGEPASKAPGRDRNSYELSPPSVPSGDSTDRDRSSPPPLRDPGGEYDSGLVPPDLPELNGAKSNLPSAPKVDGASGRSDAATPEENPLDGLGDLDNMIDEGQAVDSTKVEEGSAAQPRADERAGANEPAKDAEADGLSLPAEKDDSGDLLPAPGGPEPPGKSDLEIPPVLPGEVLPPSSLDEQEAKPPGQILLPDSAQQAGRIPEELRLHPSLSGGQRVDGRVENMMIVVNVLDQQGRPLDLSEFEVNAELSLVLFDAASEQSEPHRLGRWDFNAEQVQNLIKSDPISGFHVPIEWQDRQPKGEELVVHVRLRSEEDDMRCEGRLKVIRANAVAEWTPRGESLK